MVRTKYIIFTVLLSQCTNLTPTSMYYQKHQQANPNTAKIEMSPEEQTKIRNSFLVNILQTDDVAMLQTFIQTSPNFDWTSLRTGLQWTKETSTPLITAVWFSAQNCLKYLFANNIGNIKSSIETKNSHNLTALDYAKNPPILKKYKAIKKMLKNQNQEKLKKGLKETYNEIPQENPTVFKHKNDLEKF